ncbi:hypothetical protein [Mycobacterium sp. E3339]|uniref:hypothetical protein n=1 Tax=Mycobacterium sp. E3339 TaxID=1834146 RepID=UPI0009ED6D84
MTNTVHPLFRARATTARARVCGYEITPGSRGVPAPGFGRIGRVRLQVSGVCAGRRVTARARAG